MLSQSSHGAYRPSLTSMSWLWPTCHECDQYVLSVAGISWVWPVCPECGHYVMSVVGMSWVWLTCPYQGWGVLSETTVIRKKSTGVPLTHPSYYYCFFLGPFPTLIISYPSLPQATELITLGEACDKTAECGDSTVVILHSTTLHFTLLSVQ